MRRYEKTVVTIADGSAEAFTPHIRGFLESIQYVKAGVANYTDGVDFTITDETTGESLWTDTNVNASEIVRPRAPVMDQVGAARLYAAGGTAVADKIAINGRIKIALAAGGDTKTGLFRFIVS
jgi:hypothetical protein